MESTQKAGQLVEGGEDRSITSGQKPQIWVSQSSKSMLLCPGKSPAARERMDMENVARVDPYPMAVCQEGLKGPKAQS